MLPPLLPVRERALDRIAQQHHHHGIGHELRRTRRCERVVEVVGRGVDRNRLDPVSLANPARASPSKGRRSGTNGHRGRSSPTGSTCPSCSRPSGRCRITAGCSCEITPQRRRATTLRPDDQEIGNGTEPMPSRHPAPADRPLRRVAHRLDRRPVAARHPTRLSLPRFGAWRSRWKLAQLLGAQSHGRGETDDHDLREQPVDRSLDDEHHDRDVRPERDRIRAHGPRIRACRPSTRAAGPNPGTRNDTITNQTRPWVPTSFHRPAISTGAPQPVSGRSCVTSMATS